MLSLAYVETDAASRFTFEQIAILLEARSVEVDLVFCTSFDEALICLPAERPHFVFINLRLEHEGVSCGLTLTQTLRHHPLCAASVLIGVMDYAMPADERNALRAGCDEFLPKPLRYQAVEDLILRYTDEAIPAPTPPVWSRVS